MLFWNRILIFFIFSFLAFISLLPYRQVCLLLKRGADLSLMNEAAEDALSIAIKNANADIVTL